MPARPTIAADLQQHIDRETATAQPAPASAPITPATVDLALHVMLGRGIVVRTVGELRQLLAVCDLPDALEIGPLIPVCVSYRQATAICPAVLVIEDAWAPLDRLSVPEVLDQAGPYVRAALAQQGGTPQ